MEYWGRPKSCPFWHIAFVSFGKKNFQISPDIFLGFFNQTHLGTTTFYCIEMTIYYTPYNIIHSRQKLASDRYLQHFFHICSDPAPCLQPFFHTPSPAYDILGCTTDPPIQSKLEQPLGLFMLFIYRYIYVLAIHFLGYHIFYYFFFRWRAIGRDTVCQQKCAKEEYYRIGAVQCHLYPWNYMKGIEQCDAHALWRCLCLWCHSSCLRCVGHGRVSQDSWRTPPQTINVKLLCE